MKYDFGDGHELMIKKDGCGYDVTFLENGRRLGTEAYATIEDIEFDYGIEIDRENYIIGDRFAEWMDANKIDYEFIPEVKSND